MRAPIRRPRPLADLLDACLAPALRAQGFASADVISSWPEIVGERLSAFSQPVKLEWKRREAGFDPGRRPEPATLVVRVESAFALEMQHLAPQVAERVNAHYGWRCVGRIVLKQGPVRRSTARPEPPVRVGEEGRRVVAASVAGIEEDGLRSALDRLGLAVLGDAAAREPTKP